MRNLAEEMSHTPMSSLTQGTLAISPDTSFGHDEDITRESSQHGIVTLLARQATPAEVDTSGPSHDDLRQTIGELYHDFQRLRERVVRLESVENRIRALE